MRLYGARNRRRWAIGVAVSWESTYRGAIIQFGPWVAWVQVR